MLSNKNLVEKTDALFYLFKFESISHPLTEEKIIIREINGFVWVDCYNVSLEEAKELIEPYKLSLPLVKDALQTGHLPKYEPYDDGQFFILRAYTAREEDIISNVQQLSDKIAFFIGDQQLVTFHKFSFSFLPPENLNFSNSYSLMFQLVRSILKTYEQPAEWHANEIDSVEKLLFTEKMSIVSLEDLYYQKLEIRLTKKLLSFTQNVLNLLKTPDHVRSEHQDLKENLVQLHLEYEESLEDANNLTNTYLSLTSKKSNDVMKLLTVFSAFFLPLTFIAGVYGMNFENMPEIKSEYGYFITIGAMVLVSAVIYIWFKRKKIL